MDLLAVISYPPIPIFDVGPLRLSLHGLFAGVGFVAGAYYATRLYHARGFDATRFQSALTWALVGALLGARWLTLPAYWLENGFDIRDMINIGGNFSILGGFAGGIGLGIWRAYRVGLRVWPTLDVTRLRPGGGNRGRPHRRSGDRRAPGRPHQVPARLRDPPGIRRGAPAQPLGVRGGRGG